jgi:hypothetical protein
MTDEDVSRLLREVAREETGTTTPDFTGRVLARLDAPPRPRARARHRSLALGLAAALLGAALLSRGYFQERLQRSRTADRVRELRAEYRDLQAELDKLRALTREIEPVLELGGTERVDFVLDLRDLPREGGGEPAATPASHSVENGRGNR